MKLHYQHPRIRQILRAPELVRDNGAPLVDNTKFSAFSKRLISRLATVQPTLSTVGVSPGMLQLFESTYINEDSSKKFHFDELKIVLLVLPQLLRDIIRPEVCQMYVIHVSPRYFMIIHYSSCLQNMNYRDVRFLTFLYCSDWLDKWANSVCTARITLAWRWGVGRPNSWNTVHLYQIHWFLDASKTSRSYRKRYSRVTDQGSQLRWSCKTCASRKSWYQNASRRLDGVECGQGSFPISLCWTGRVIRILGELQHAGSWVCAQG